MQNLSHIVFGNYILTVSLFAWTVAQVSKTAIHAFLCGKFQAERLWGAGGMPSSHSALVCALAVSAAKSEGMASPIFALALVLALIVMYDATGVRRETGNQAKVLNLMRWQSPCEPVARPGVWPLIGEKAFSCIYWKKLIPRRPSRRWMRPSFPHCAQKYGNF